MNQKAQSVMEIISLVVVVLIVAVSVFMYMNSNNTNLANLSNINLFGKSSSEGVQSKDNSVNINNSFENIRVNVETAGSLSNKVANMSQEDILNGLKDKTPSQMMNVKSSDDEDVFDLANKLIVELDLNAKKIDKKNISEETKLELAQIALIAKERLNGSQNATYTMYNALLAEILN